MKFINMLKKSELLSVDGVKLKCPLNRLTAFHACKDFPPDLLHDALEGIVPVCALQISFLRNISHWMSLIVKYKASL